MFNYLINQITLNRKEEGGREKVVFSLTSLFTLKEESMKGKITVVMLTLVILALWGGVGLSQDTYVGSDRCMTCHNSTNTNTGYNIYEMYMKSGHPYKLNAVNGAQPEYPENTSPGVPNPPMGTSWNDFSYVIGGYGWKARFIKNDGKIYTVADNAQYNLANKGWVSYHTGEDKAYNQACFVCHTTGADTAGSWNNQTPGLGTFTEAGIRCEGCHGPSSGHAGNPIGVKPPITADSLAYARCGDCHSRDSKTNAIPASGNYVRHHEQFNEMQASKHGDMSYTCTTCHDAHIPLVYPEAADGHDAITKKCEDCHTDKQVLMNGVAKANVECVDCHMPKAAKSALGKKLGNGWQGDIASHIWNINTDAVPRDSMFTADGKFVKLDGDGHAGLTLDFACLQCHQEKDVQWASVYAENIHDNGITVVAGNYVGSSICKTCHDNINPNAGYNIWEEYSKSGHPYKLNKVEGGHPTYPANTTPGVELPAGKTWDDFSYVIGGYGWKARFVKLDGKIFTASDSAQYNLADGSWALYHKDEDRPYNQACFQCHTTGSDPNGSWNDITPELGTFSEPGIRCEGCHGPASEHVASPAIVSPPIVGDSLKFDHCGDCHNRDGKTNAIPASKNYIKHHEQFNEMKASKHGDGNSPDLTCASCHNSHIAVHYPDVAGDGLSGIKVDCATCHPNHQITVNGNPKSIDCVDCHMPKASKSALGATLGNGFKGDVSTHIMGINTEAVPRDSMFTLDGNLVRLDAEGLASVTLDFACLACHQSGTVEWAAGFAKDIHTNGITTSVEEVTGLPTEFSLKQNYPNPFNPTTTVEFSLPSKSMVKVVVYTAAGQHVVTLVDGNRPAGVHRAVFNGDGLASGIYIVKINSDFGEISSKMMLVK
jgi:hypothetical protein